MNVPARPVSFMLLYHCIWYVTYDRGASSTGTSPLAYCNLRQGSIFARNVPARFTSPLENVPARRTQTGKKTTARRNSSRRTRTSTRLFYTGIIRPSPRTGLTGDTRSSLATLTNSTNSPKVIFTICSAGYLPQSNDSTSKRATPLFMSTVGSKNRIEQGSSGKKNGLGHSISRTSIFAISSRISNNLVSFRHSERQLGDRDPTCFRKLE